MAIECVTKVEDVRQILKSQQWVVIDFMAEWCGPCKMLGPKLHKLAETHPYIQFLKVDVDQMDAAFIQEQAVTAMPTIKFYRSVRHE